MKHEGTEPSPPATDSIQSNGRSRLVLVLKLAFAAIVFYWLARSGRMELSELGTVWQRWPWLLAALAATGVGLFLTVWRWQILLRVQDIVFSYRETLRVCCIGLFFNQFLLGSVGGDLYRVFAVARTHPERSSAGAVSVLVDRVTGLLATLMLLPIALIFTWDRVWTDPTLSYLVTVVLLLIAGGVLVSCALLSESIQRLSPVRWCLDRLPMRDRFRRVRSAITVHMEHPRTMIAIGLLGMVIQVLVVVTNICLAYALIPSFDSIAFFFLLIPIALTAMALPINPPGALGTGEAMYAYLLGIVGVQSGSLLSLLQRGVLIVWAIPGAILYVASPRPAPASNPSPT